MQETLQLFKELPLKTKKQRQKGARHQFFSTAVIESGFQAMIKSGMKNTSIIEMLKRDLLKDQILQQSSVKPKRMKSQPQSNIINYIEQKNFTFFNENMQTKNFKRGIDQVMLKLNKRCDQQSKQKFEKDVKQFDAQLSPIKSGKSKFSSLSRKSSLKRKTRHSVTLPSKDVIQLHKIPVQDVFDFRKKRTNTFLFHLPTKKIAKRIVNIISQIEKDWEEQLLQNVNILQGTNIKSKKNIKIQRQKISNYLKAKFINQIITTYFKFEPIETFSFLREVIDNLIHLQDKEMKLLTFFTYDINQDGFICEEDIYYYLTRLPFHSKIVEDLNMIVQFLRKNKLRSIAPNLPERLLKLRQKSLYVLLDEQKPTNSKLQPIDKKKSFTQKLFSAAKKQDKDLSLRQSTIVDKKYQINFQVFCLIFAQKLPVLIRQVILSLTKRITNQNCEWQDLSQQIAKPELPKGKQGEQWSRRMNRTKHLLTTVQKQNKKLSEKIVQCIDKRIL